MPERRHDVTTLAVITADAGGGHSVTKISFAPHETLA
jgi:hypothetical protein